MKLDLSQWRLRKESDRIHVLHLLHFSCFLLSIIVHHFGSKSILLGLLILFFFLMYSHLFYRTLKKLYYTYWTFALLLLTYFFLSLFWLDISDAAFYLRFLGLVFLGAQMWTLHDPIYYPIVSWWEYDFRYRDDVKVSVGTLVKEEREKSNVMEGRITDIRRKAACLALFEELEIGEEVEVVTKEHEVPSTFKLKIMSKRETSIGRPFHYGARFILSNDSERSEYERFLDFWKNERRDKIKQKFQE